MRRIGTSPAQAETVAERERRIAAAVREAVLRKAYAAKKEGQTLILGLDESWIPNKSAVQPIISEFERLPENLRRLGLDNVVFVRGEGDDVAIEIQKKQPIIKTPFSNIFVIGSPSILTSKEYAKLRGADEKDKAVLAGVDAKNLSEFTDVPVVEMYLRAIELGSGKGPSEMDRSFIDIIPSGNGSLFTPIRPHDIERSRELNDIIIREIDSRA